ncbi:MAG: MFS transporter [Deltaproteobacteria bacterium]|nr:MFS transporter [Deltaproteobacteria bacterium]
MSRREAWAVVAVATFTMTVSYIDRATLAVLAPAVTKALDIDETAYGWLASAFSVAYLVATPVAGWWIDRVGARRGLVGSVLVWSAVAALHAVVPTFGMLFAFRIALGLAEGPGFPGAAQTVQTVLEPRDRARGFGLLFTGSSIGGMLVPPLATWIWNLYGWRVAFLGTAVVGLLWIPLWIAVTRRPNVRAVLDHRTRDAARAQRPKLLELLRQPAMIRALVGVLAAAPVIGLVHGWGSKYLVREFGLGQGDVGAYLWLPPLVFDVGAIAFGDAAARRLRHGDVPRGLYAIGAVLAAAMALLPLARTPWEGMAIASVSLAGGGCLYTIGTADLLARVRPEAVSFAGGTLAAAQSIALIVVNPLVGASVDSTQSYDTSAIALGLWVLPGSIAWIAWPIGRIPREGDSP